jgi:hypothetical protein
MVEQNRRRSPAVDKKDIDWLMQQPGVSGVLEDTAPLHIITEKNLPPQTERAITERFGAGNFELHPDGPITAQGGGRTSVAQPPRPAPAPSADPAKGGVSGLRQFKRDSTQK